MTQAMRSFARVAGASWAIATVSFACVYLLPGDPARLILGPQAAAATVAAFREEAGLNDSVAYQYANYMVRLARLDFGHSHSTRRPVAELLRERGEVSGALAGTALLVAIVIGIVVPSICHTWRWHGLLRRVRVLTTALALAPPHVLAVLALLLFAGVLGWIPVIFQTQSIFGWLVSGAVLASYPTALVLQLFDARLRQELASPHCLRARAAGLPMHVVVLTEAGRNAVPAALAAVANGLAFFVTGALFVEATFGIPGLGRLTQDAVRMKDVTVLVGVCVVIGVVVSSLSRLLEITVALLIPRARSHAN